MKVAWRYAVVVAALMAGSLLLGACGGEEEENGAAPAAATETATPTESETPTEEAAEQELDLDQYLQRVEDIIDAAETSSDAMIEESEGFGEDIEPTRDVYDAAAAIFGQSVNDLKGLDAPAEVRDAHEEFVAAMAGMVAVMEDIRDQVADLESPSELEALGVELAEPFGAASERFEGACLQLQGIADDNDIDVDLKCD